MVLLRAASSAYLKYSRRFKIHSPGFTLIELMVIIAIVIILAAISINSYDSQKHRGIRADGISALMQAVDKLEQCAMDNNGIYTTCTIPPSIKSSRYYKLSRKITNNGKGYMVNATRNNGKDPECVLTINNLGQRSTLITAKAKHCWNGV